MASPAIELQKAIFAALSGDAALAAALGGGRIHDRVPENAPFPYVVFGRSSVYDWSTCTEIGTEHLVSLHVWSKAKGREETLSIMELISARLEAGLALTDNHLVSLAPDFSEVRYDDDLSLHHGLLRYRALIEAPDGDA